MINDLPLFSPKGKEVFEVIISLQEDDERVRLFAKRFARTVTSSDAGTIGKSGPLENFLLCGTSFSSIPLLVHVAAETWLGKPWDGSLPFTYIDCSAYHAVYPGMLAPLVGPLPPDALGFYGAPLLGQIGIPNLKVRRGDHLSVLEQWADGFQKRWREHILELGGEAAEFYRSFRLMVSEEWRKIYDEEVKKNGPLLSLIFFDGVDRASPPLQELILQILRTASLPLANGIEANFSNSVIIMSVYRNEKMLRSGEMGFSKKRSSHASSLVEDYQKVRSHLREDITSMPFVLAVAENFIIINERNRESQRKRIKSELEKIRSVWAKHGIALHCSDAFIEGFLDDTKEIIPEGTQALAEVYTEERIISGIKRHILDVLNRMIVFKRLHSGAELLFDCAPSNACQMTFTVKKEGDGDIVAPQGDDKTIAQTTSDSPLPDWLVPVEKRAREILLARQRAFGLRS